MNQLWEHSWSQVFGSFWFTMHEMIANCCACRVHSRHAWHRTCAVIALLIGILGVPCAAYVHAIVSFEKRHIGCTMISIVLIHNLNSFWNFHLRQQDARSSSTWSLWDGISGKRFGFWRSSWLAVSHGALILFFLLGIRYVASLLRRSFALVFSWSCSLCGCVSFVCEDGVMAAHGARWYDGERPGVRPDDQPSFEDLDPEHVSLSSESCRMNG